MAKHEMWKRNWVTVRCWSSRGNGGDGVGHITLEANGVYASIWPIGAVLAKNHDKTKPQVCNKAHARVFIPSYREDCKLEGRPPERTLTVYSLDVDNIKIRFNELRKNCVSWALLGNKLWLTDASHSCATLVKELLDAGGIMRSHSLTRVTAGDLGKFEKFMAPVNMTVMYGAAWFERSCDGPFSTPDNIMDSVQRLKQHENDNFELSFDCPISCTLL